MNRISSGFGGTNAAPIQIDFDQGVAGAEQAMMTGLVFGTVFAVTEQIWMLMCAHAAFDLTALAIIYWNLESVVGHLIFK